MVSKERINEYKEWFDNLSFFQSNPFVFEHIEDLWNLINYIGFNYEKFIKFKLNGSYTQISIDEVIKICQSFLDEYKINISINEMIDNKTLIFKNIEELDEFYNNRHDGHNYYDDFGNRIISINLSGTIIDAFILIHELSHFRNQPDNKRGFTNDLLTESIAYGNELIFCDYLKNRCPDEAKFHFQGFEKLLYNYAYNIYYIYKVILLYKKKKDINKDLYNELFNDNGYDKTIEMFEKYAFSKRHILRDTWYVIGLPLAIYFFYEYKKDSNYFYTLEEFNDVIKYESLDVCLKTIGINNKQDFIDKIKCSTNFYIEFLDELYINDTKKYKSRRVYFFVL